MNLIFAFAALVFTGLSQTVVLDPGHPSERSSGAQVLNGTSEVHVCWLVAKKVKALLEADGIRVVMTKSREKQLVTNRNRAAIANRNHAALFLRLHTDSARGSGYTVYFPDRRGKAFGKTGPATRVIAESRSAASKFHDVLTRELGDSLRDNGVKGDSKTYVGGKQGALTGSIFSEVPVLTVEMCVLSNRRDADFIKSEKGREALAGALARGVRAVVGR